MLNVTRCSQCSGIVENPGAKYCCLLCAKIAARNKREQARYPRTPVLDSPEAEAKFRKLMDPNYYQHSRFNAEWRRRLGA